MEETYYIICYASDGIVNFCYCWFFDVENKYERGKGWSSEFGGPWTDLEDPGWGPEFLKLDLCFITYYQPPPKSSTYSYQMINWLINRFPNAFPILRIILEI